MRINPHDASVLSFFRHRIKGIPHPCTAVRYEVYANIACAFPTKKHEISQ